MATQRKPDGFEYLYPDTEGTDQLGYDTPLYDTRPAPQIKPADQVGPQAGGPAPNAGAGYQWNANNVFQNWDLNPLAMQVGGAADGVRDTLSTSRDAYLQPLMNQYRDQARQTGVRADATDQSLFADPNFQSFVQSGQMPQGTSRQHPDSGFQAGPSGFGQGLQDALTKYFSGSFNQDLSNRRIDNVRDTLNRQRKSQMATNDAHLADRGIGVNEGPSRTAAGSLEDRLNQNFNSSVNDIYANEFTNADNRALEALRTAAGVNASNQNNELGWGNLDLNRTLGLGNLALGNQNSENSYNLGLGQLGVNRDTLAHAIESGNIDQLIEVLKLFGQGAGITQEGYIK
jgi:hypothetical protein